MEKNVLLQISESLDLINKSLLSSGGVKPFVPVIAALSGVVIGVGLNMIKDHRINKSKIKKYKQCIKNEIEIIHDENNENFKSIMRISDKIVTCNKYVVNHNFTPSNYICFDRFFPEIVSELTKEESRLINLIYSTSRSFDSYVGRLMDKTQDTQDEEEIKSIIILLDAIMSLILIIHSSCCEFLHKEQLGEGNEILLLAEQLNFCGPFYEHVLNIERNN